MLDSSRLAYEQETTAIFLRDQKTNKQKNWRSSDLRKRLGTDLGLEYRPGNSDLGV